MASREQKGNKEKKKPKADKNKKQKHMPYGGKTPMGVLPGSGSSNKN
jgi:hypothetical protein